ncbi:unnamed protein product [Zymoseptoria tritici ST99CH_1A5]|uniref:Inosine/uridine-preferring nucleoside hydrolase domain-containing protein n=1 Tax=Zymoseptoria tritici ST99CH_1A5 TaxID=1276529 RepID=A0A1Y6L7R3_ZYMTR|nr:unnamed protein product [Zymoseptoria tritici ST99CH_1A5]
MARKIIIDTDPGVDDILAMLLAFSALPEELEVLLISVTYGNIDLQNCLRNVVSLFRQIEKEIEFRKSQGKPLGFDTLRKTKPLVAVGPEKPLADQILMADFFHGRDGLAGIHETHPHLTPDETWKQLFTQSEKSKDVTDREVAEELQNAHALFQASKLPGHEEILRLLRENESDTITIVAVGPLTNLAIAASSDPETFLRVKEVVVMGGNVDEKGNMTPVAEFNTFADTIAAARVYALTSPTPSSTMPPIPPPPPGIPTDSHPPPFLGPYPKSLSRQLRVVLFPLDVTNYHLLARGEFRSLITPIVESKSPLGEWVSIFMNSTFDKVETLQTDVSGDDVALQLHDPLCIWYCMAIAGSKSNNFPEQWKILEDEDLRVETAGQWTRGMCVIDRRARRKRDVGDAEGERPDDIGNWLSLNAGNRMGRCLESPGKDRFGRFLIERVFGLE